MGDDDNDGGSTVYTTGDTSTWVGIDPLVVGSQLFDDFIGGGVWVYVVMREGCCFGEIDQAGLRRTRF